jgi:hypothetical protein
MSPGISKDRNNERRLGVKDSMRQGQARLGSSLNRLAALLLFFAFPYPGTSQQASRTDSFRFVQEQNIREVVFRYLFDHNASGQQRNALIFCLSLSFDEHVDPSDEFMKRFDSHNPPVRKISDCAEHPFAGVTDKRTGKRALLLRVTTIQWISEVEGEVGGGYYEGPLNASGNTFRVVRSRGQWKVVGDKLNWIS